MNNMKRTLFISLMIVLSSVFAVFSPPEKAQAQRAKAGFTRENIIQQPIYSDYKGVRLGMTAAEARAKLGTPAIKDNEQDYYIFSDRETAQIVYDAAGKVITISVDYLGGVGAPDPRTVVAGDLEETVNGNLYRIVHYQSQGFWVSYHRSAGPGVMVTITLQKMK